MRRSTGGGSLQAEVVALRARVAMERRMGERNTRELQRLNEQMKQLRAEHGQAAQRAFQLNSLLAFARDVLPECAQADAQATAGTSATGHATSGTGAGASQPGSVEAAAGCDDDVAAAMALLQGSSKRLALAEAQAGKRTAQVCHVGRLLTPWLVLPGCRLLLLPDQPVVLEWCLCMATKQHCVAAGAELLHGSVHLQCDCAQEP